jgi:hypothetical protein
MDNIYKQKYKKYKLKYYMLKLKQGGDYTYNYNHFEDFHKKYINENLLGYSDNYLFKKNLQAFMTKNSIQFNNIINKLSNNKVIIIDGMNLVHNSNFKTIFNLHNNTNIFYHTNRQLFINIIKYIHDYYAPDYYFIVTIHSNNSDIIVIDEYIYLINVSCQMIKSVNPCLDKQNYIMYERPSDKNKKDIPQPCKVKLTDRCIAKNEVDDYLLCFIYYLLVLHTVIESDNVKNYVKHIEDIAVEHYDIYVQNYITVLIYMLYKTYDKDYYLYGYDYKIVLHKLIIDIFFDYLGVNELDIINIAVQNYLETIPGSEQNEYYLDEILDYAQQNILLKKLYLLFIDKNINSTNICSSMISILVDHIEKDNWMNLLGLINDLENKFQNTFTSSINTIKREDNIFVWSGDKYRWFYLHNYIKRCKLDTSKKDKNGFSISLDYVSPNNIIR